MAKAKHRIRITGAGIHGAPTEANPTGEYPIGFEFDTDSDLPAGWAGRAIVVGDEPAEGAEFITGANDDSEIGKARQEIIDRAEKHIAAITAEHSTALAAVLARAEKAEGDLAAANDTIASLTAKLADTGQGNDAATAEEIKAAVALLDGKVADHWTAAGLPAVDAVAELTGKAVTRKAIEEAAPDAKRPA